jgi:anti-sigma regulatory factor (Ser/Thr protein kinase)
VSTLTSTVGRSLRLTSPCDLAAVREAGRMVRAFLEQQSLSQPELDAWELVLAEAGNNAVEHTTPDAMAKPIEFAVEVSVTQVEVRVTDHTPGFDLPDNPQLPDAFSESGRGLFLIRELTDKVRYLRARSGNCLLMQRARAAAGKNEEVNSVAAAEIESTLQLMTEELAASYESLAAIFRFTAEMNRASVGRDFAERWLRELLSITGADWFALRLLSRDQKRLELDIASRPDLALDPLPLNSKGATAGDVGEVAAVNGRQDVWFDAQSPLREADPLSKFGSSLSGVIHPIFVNGDLVGVLGVGRYAREQTFNAGQVNIIHTFADFLGIQIRNNRIQESYLESRLLRRELEIAATIQKSLLPERL